MHYALSAFLCLSVLYMQKYFKFYNFKVVRCSEMPEMRLKVVMALFILRMC